MACWRSGLTHCPLKAAFTGPNPVQATKRKLHDNYRVFFNFRTLYGIRTNESKIIK